MTNDEFHRWLTEHKRHFPMIQPWLGKLGMNLQGVLATWMKHLEPVGFEEACSASARLWEHESQPKTYDRHPVEIRKFCKRTAGLAERQVFGRSDGSVKCKRCSDAGIVTVFYFRSRDVDENGVTVRVREIFDAGTVIEHVLADGNEDDLRTACLRCDCGAGDRWTCHPFWREFCLISEGCRASRKADGWWTAAEISRMNAPGANSTSTFGQLATAGIEAF